MPTLDDDATDGGDVLSRIFVGLYVTCLGVGVVAYVSYYLVIWLSSQGTEDKLTGVFLQAHLLSFAVVYLMSLLFPALWLATRVLRSLSRRLGRRE